MSAIKQTTAPAVEPVSLAEAKTFLRVSMSGDDAQITGLISAAREYSETFCNRSFAVKGYVQYLDCFPYYVDGGMQSQLALPQSYYSLPRYSPTLWNYSQMIKLMRSPVTLVSKITYVKPDGTETDLLPGTDFIVDYAAEPVRVFPLAGKNWPACLYCPNAVRIFFAAGMTSPVNDPASSPVAPDNPEIDITVSGTPPNQVSEYKFYDRVPASIRTAILQLVSHWYFNREPVTQGVAGSVPNHVDALLWSNRVEDFAQTRG
jgi:hypothetical protein